MRSLKKRFLATGTALGLAAALVQPASAQEFDLAGVWQADNGESRYEMQTCGDGTQLCARLTWIQPDKINERNAPYIDTMVVDQAVLTSQSPMTWRGKINLYGHTVDGTVTQVHDDRYAVKGCALIVICVDMGVTRVADAD